MSQDKYIKRISGNKLFRAMAWVALIVIIGLIIATFITGITGSKYFMGCLVLSIIVPVFAYVVIWVGRLLYDSANKDEAQNTETAGKDSSDKQ